MTDIQAALGLSQMSRLDQYVAIRNQLAQRYDELLAKLPVIVPAQAKDCYSSRHLYVVRLKLDEIDKSRRQVFESLREQGVGVQIHYIPVHLQPYYQKMGWKKGDFPVSENYYQHCISLPMFPTLNNMELEYIVNKIISFHNVSDN